MNPNKILEVNGLSKNFNNLWAVDKFSTFYFLRKLAAKIFRVSILISGQEPSIREIIRMARK